METCRQCCRSGGSVCFWASLIWIRHYLYRSGCGSGSGPFHQQANKVRKTLIFFLLLFDFLSSQTDINVPLKSNMQKNLRKKTYFFVGFLTATDEKSRIWIQIFGSGSIPKCHGSTTLHAGYKLTVYKVLVGTKVQQV